MDENKRNRMALAGFILSLMGVCTVVTSPLQLTALLLCLSAGKTSRFGNLRRVGILLSAVFLALSVLLWVLFFCYSHVIVPYLSEFLGEFYY